MRHPREFLRRADRLQRRVPWLAFPVAVWKKFSDDRAGNLAALIAYFSFVSIFPLLLVLITVLDIAFKHDPSLRHQMLNSAVRSFPVIGRQLRLSVHVLHRTGLALAVGLIGALLGARGVAGAMQNALNTIWAVPFSRRPDFPRSTLRGLGLVLAVGIGEILTAFLSGIAGGLGHVVSGSAATVGTVIVSYALNVGLFWLAFKLAVAAEVTWRDLRLVALLSAASWQILLLLGTYIVNHELRHATALYGVVFGVVLGLLAWLYLQAYLTLYAVEVGTVRKWRLWPRGLIPPLTEADQRAYQPYERAGRRRPG